MGGRTATYKYIDIMQLQSCQKQGCIQSWHYRAVVHTLPEGTESNMSAEQTYTQEPQH